MFKNVFKIGMLVAGLAFGCSAFAQEKTYAPEYPQYGFWSNWSLGGMVDFSHQDNAGSALGLILSAEKELNYVWDVRFNFGAPGILQLGDNPYDRFATATAGFKFGIIDACKGYNPDRKGNLYLALDGGLAGVTKVYDFGRAALMADGALGYSYKCCKNSTLFAEAGLMTVADVGNIFKLFSNDNPMTWSAYVGLGYQYNFGPTAADLELIAARALVTQENVDNLNSQINTLNGEVAESQKEVQKLKNNIEQLNDRLRNVVATPDNSKADSLRAVIDQIKADQLTYYALPFSILFELDQYQIPADQMNKVKAIARVINDTEGAKFKVVGFCDKSGSDEWNMKLSEKRANALKKALVKQGVAEDRIEVEYYGKSMAFGDISFSVNRRASVYRVIE